MSAPIDPASLAGKHFAISDNAGLIVLGAGPAGIAAALEARRLGLEVMLVDEHPVSAALIGLDIPYMFGDRLDASVQNKERMLERIVAARPELEEAMDAGIDVRLGTYVWAAFVRGQTSRALPKPIIGLADEQHSWLATFDRIIVASGARDLALAFPGWDLPGVIGARAFTAALDLYQAFAGRRIAVLGADTLGQYVAGRALQAGLDVAAMIDVRTAAALPGAQVPQGVPVHPGHAIRGTIARAGNLEGLHLSPINAPHAGFDIACDTVVSALDLIPTVEAFDLLGCTIEWRPERGGFVPAIDAEGRTSVAGVYAAGDCAGVTPRMIADPGHAVRAGRRAAQAAARDAGLAVETEGTAPTSPDTGPDRDSLRRQWLEAHLSGRDDTLICRCEEVGVRELLGVRPPRYLKYDETHFAHRDLRSLAADGPINQDQVKRLTRAGMGACQGRRCREQVQVLLAMQGNQPTGSVAMPSYRAPLRPLPLNVLSAHDETPDMRETWPIWFGIPSQWLPQWEKVPDVIDPRDSRIGLQDAVE